MCLEKSCEAIIFKTPDELELHISCESIIFNIGSLSFIKNYSISKLALQLTYLMFNNFIISAVHNTNTPKNDTHSSTEFLSRNYKCNYCDKSYTLVFYIRYIIF